MIETQKMQVFVYRPGADTVKAIAERTCLVEEFLRETCKGWEELFVFVGETEDRGGDLDVDVEVIEVSKDKKLGELLVSGKFLHLHCHHCRRIEVKVKYGKEALEHRFAPSTRVNHVLRWAKHKLKLKDADAENLSLFPCGGGDKVVGSKHLGELTTGKTCDICFSLAKEINPEG